MLEENPFLIITVRAFLAFFWAITTKPVLLSDNLQASFVFAAKLWSNEEELHERVDAVDAIATLSFTLTQAHTLSPSHTYTLLGFMRFMILSLCYASVMLQWQAQFCVLSFWPLCKMQTTNFTHLITFELQQFTLFFFSFLLPFSF